MKPSVGAALRDGTEPSNDNVVVDPAHRIAAE
jgi:hypothetical protein